MMTDPTQLECDVGYLLTEFSFQMEFYFGDSNLNKDRFLWNVIQQTEDGCE